MFVRSILASLCEMLEGYFPIENDCTLILTEECHSVLLSVA